MNKILSTLLISSALLTTFSANANAASYDKATTSKKVNVYQKAGTSYKILYTIPKGKAVKVIGAKSQGDDQANWFTYQYFAFSKVTYKNKKGYIKTDDLRFKHPYAWSPGIKKIADAQGKFSADGKKYRLVKSGTYLTQGHYYIQIKQDGKWFTRNGINCKTGMIH